MQPLYIRNSLTRERELFEPLNAPHVGMYVCGPTVYSNVHLGNVRTFLSFDSILGRGPGSPCIPLSICSTCPHF